MVRVSLLSLCVAAAAVFASGVSARPIAPPRSTECAFAGYDLSSLAGKSFSAADTLYKYAVNVCGVLAPGETPCDSGSNVASACQWRQSSQPALSFDVGNFASTDEWSFVNSKDGSDGVQYSMVGQDTCWASGAPTNYESNVAFVCGPAATPATATANQCTVNYTITTPLVCGSAPNPPPTPSYRCGFGGIDLSSLVGTDIKGSDGSQTYAYFLSVCGVIESQPACTQLSSTSSACQVQVEPRGSAYDIGNWGNPAPKFEFTNGVDNTDGIMYSLTGDDACWASGAPTPYTTNVMFECGQGETEMTVATQPRSCSLNMTVSTPAACGIVPPPIPPTPVSFCTGEIDGNEYDLSSLAGSDITLQTSDPASSFFALRVCGAVTASQCENTPNTTAACMQISSPHVFESDLGDAFTAKALDLSYINPAQPSLGVQYSLVTVAATCANQGGYKPFTTTVQLVCASSQGNLTVSWATGCSPIFSVPTPAACPPPAVMESEIALF